MARSQFSLYEMRIRRLRAKGEYFQVAKFGPRRDDLLEIYNQFLDSEVKGAGKKIDRGERYVRLKASEIDFRIIWFTVDAGRYGVPGKIIETDTGTDAHDIAREDAASYPLRQALIVPNVGEFALWATETVGHASALGALSSSFKDWFRARYDSERLYLETNHFQDANAWNEFIARASLNEITYIVHERDPDSAAGVRVQEHRMKAVRRNRLPSPWIKRALERNLPPESVFSTREMPEADEVRMQIESHGRYRTIVVDHDLPRFMYQVDDDASGTPTDAAFRSAVLSEVSASLEYMHVDRRTWQR